MEIYGEHDICQQHPRVFRAVFRLPHNALQSWRRKEGEVSLVAFLAPKIWAWAAQRAGGLEDRGVGRLDGWRLTFQPQGLELGVILGREVVMLEQAVQLLVLSPVECDDRLGLQHGLVQLQLITLWQRPEEAAQSFDVARLLENL